MYTHVLLTLLGMLVVLAFWMSDFKLLWDTKSEVKEVYWIGLRDYYFWGLCIVPSLFSHMVATWGHYYRADSIFQRSVRQVSWPASMTAQERNMKRLNAISLWERHDPYVGWTYRFWVLVVLAFGMNIAWFLQPMLKYLGPQLAEHPDENPVIIWMSFIGYGSGYAAIIACAIIMFVVLRRSVLHALGFTYAELLPMHRGMGIAVLFWSVVHTIGYSVHYIMDDEWEEQFNFDGETRGPQNIIGFVALAALIALYVFSLPYFRRRFYEFFLFMHRVMTVLTFVGTLMHYPYFMTWYYVVPSMCLFMADRYIPRIVQAFAVAPDVICSFNKEADILTMVIVSRSRLEPLKPYYPGDYINLQNTVIGQSYHPFTIASYWPDDPYSMTLYIRTFGENPDSWTRGLARLCSSDDDPILVNMNVEGVFGDRSHDYLCSNNIVIFAAGAAITTFMPLLKSIAAHIEAAKADSLEPQNTIKVHLLSTFRYESELYSYGDFLHQVTTDPRFTSWLHVEIHVSRADKVPRKVVSSTENAAHDRKIKPAMSTASEGSEIETHSESSHSVDPPVYLDAAVPVQKKIDASYSSPKSYTDRPVATFPTVNSTSVATLHAQRDLFITAAILFIPFFAFVGLRFVGLEGVWKGESRWCRTTRIYDQNMTNKCMWNYTMTPGFLHIVAGALMGYGLIFYARWSTLRHGEVARVGSMAKTMTASGAELGGKGQNKTFEYMKKVHESQVMAYDGSIRYRAGRLNVKESIQELIAAEVGVKDLETTAVFVGGPDSFLDSVQEEAKKAQWTVEFHRETWSP
ncbi:hypothetical protein BGZ67_005443 [Mortierella alpina]|nr:hypothetical protein BGZ67_005443 [Mortierella alpina]